MKSISLFNGTFLLVCVLAALTGCRLKNFRLTLEMPPDNVTTASVSGAHPVVSIRNSGPGSVDVVIGEGAVSNLERITIGAGGEVKTPLDGPKTVTVTTSSERAVVRIEASEASGIQLDGPRPDDGR